MPSPPNHTLSPNPWCNDIVIRGPLRNDEVMRMEHSPMRSVPLWKRPRENSWAPSASWGYKMKKRCCLWTWKWPSPDAESAVTLILNFLDFRSVGNKCLLYKPSSLWYSVFIAAQRDWDTVLLGSSYFIIVYICTALITCEILKDRGYQSHGFMLRSL